MEKENTTYGNTYIPKYFYHYTSFESAKAILESKEFRLMDVFNMEDKDEIVYGANGCYNSILNLANPSNSSYLSDMQKLYLQIPPYFLALKFAKSTFGQDYISYFESIEDSKFKELVQIFKSTEDLFFVGCFTKSQFNKHNWNRFANKNKGIVIKFNFENLPKEIFIKQVKYLNEEGNELLIESKMKYYSQLSKNPLETMKNIIGELSRHIITAKGFNYKEEKEHRLVLPYSTYFNISKKYNIQTDDSGRKFINLPINKTDFSKRVEGVYITEEFRDENRQELSEILRNYKNARIHIVKSEEII